MDDVFITISFSAEIATLIAKLNASFALKDLGNLIASWAYKFSILLMVYTCLRLNKLLCKAKMQYANGLNFIKVLLELSNMLASLDLRFHMQ